MRRTVLVAILLPFFLGCGMLGGPRPAWEEPAPLPREGAIVPAERLHRSTLDNGVQVLVLEDKRLPRVAMGLVVPRGSASLRLTDAGLAAFSTELLNRGAGDRDALAFAQAVDSLGGSVSAGGDWDSTGVYASGLSRDFDTLSELLADVALRPRFDAEEIERLRAQQLASFERAKDDPRTLASWNLSEALFPGHPFGLPRIGTPQTVAGFDSDDVRRAHAALFVPAGAIFYATGDVSADRVRARAEQLFGAWSGQDEGGAPEALPAAPSGREVIIVDRPDLGQATVLIGGAGISRTAADRVAVGLMNIVVGGGGFSSRIMSRVRDEEGLAYYAYSAFAQRRQGGYFLVATGTRAPEAGRAIDMLLDEIGRATREPPTVDEIRHARSLAVGRFSLGLETSDAIVAALVDLDVYGLPRDSIDTYRTRVARLSDADVRKAAADHLDPERVAIVVVGPAEALTPQLERFGPVRVVQP